MTKQMKTAMATMLMIGTLPMMAQTSQTDVVKVAPGQTKKTVIHRKNGATDTVISEGTTGGAAHHHAHHTSRAKHPVRRSSRTPVESASSRQIRQLEERQAAQQAQIDALTAAGAAKDAALAQAQQQAQGAEAQAQAATASAQSVQSTVQQNSDAVQALKSNVTDLQTTNVGLAQTISANKVELAEKIDSPTVIHYKGVKITPVAFFALEGVYRTRAIQSDINTPFNTTPYPGSNDGHISEFNFSGRQSRLGGLFEGDAGKYKLSGYFEADFLSSGTTSNSNQSNSYSLRQRQIWGKGETKSGFAVTGGQMWSLVTENGKSTDARTEKLPNTIDPQYNVGYNWARQPGIRLQQKIGNPILGTAVTIAFSAEQAQIQLAGASNAPTNYIYAGAGTGGGLFNATANYANNIAPDTLVKIAFDAKYAHVEVGGLARYFRDQYYPITGFTQVTTGGVTTTTTQYAANFVKQTVVGGGVFGSARVSAGKFVDVAVQGMGGPGVGRYGSSQLGDVTVKPSGQLEPVRNYHGLFTLETHPSKKLDVYAYYGAEYNQRTYYRDSLGRLVGNAPPNLSTAGCYATTIGTAGTQTPTGAAPGTVGTCAEPTRVIQEGTVGFTYKVATSPKYGTLRYQFVYSYLTRESWEGLQTGTVVGATGSVNSEARATNNLIYAGMRYYIP